MDHARPIIEDLKAGEGAINPDQAFLGVSSMELDEVADDVRETFDVTVEAGAFVSEVVPGSAADEGGLQAGDVIVGVDGEDVEQATDVRDRILDHDPGDEVEIVIVRKGEEQTLQVTLGRRGDT